MNKQFTLICYLIFLPLLAFPQKTLNYSVDYNDSEVSGKVALKVQLDGLFEPLLRGQVTKVWVNRYQNGKYDAILREAGITFPYELTSGFDFTFEATARIHQDNVITQYGHVRISPPGNMSGMPEFPEFSKETIDWLKKHASDQSLIGNEIDGGTNFWVTHGSLINISVSKFYINDFKDKVNSIIREQESKEKEKIRKEEQAKKEAEQKAQREKEEQAKREAEAKAAQQRAASSSGSGSSSAGNSGLSSSSSGSSGYTGSSSSSSPNQLEQQRREEQRRRQEEERIDEQRKRNMELQRKLAQMKAEQERTNRGVSQAQSGLDAMASGFESGQSGAGGLLSGSSEFISGVGQATGSMGATVAAGGIAAGLSIFSAARKDKAKQRAEQAASAERARIRQLEEAERKKQEEEIARLKQQAFDALMDMRKTVINTYSSSAPIPLSATKIESDRIYYFIYATDPSFLNSQNVTVYVSNVFEIKRYNDGTWPYQTAIDEEVAQLTPFEEVMHGYYLSANEAEEMRTGFLQSLKIIEGIEIVDVSYKEKEKSMFDAADSNSKQAEGLGISIGDKKNQTVKPPEINSKQNSGLGIRIGDEPQSKKQPQKSKDKTDSKKNEKSGSLGIKIE